MKQRGFTLVEVMVALTILSLVMVATVTGLRTLASTQTSIERVTERVDEVRTVSSFLRDTLESAVMGPSTGSSGGLSFGGSSGGTGSSFFRISEGGLEWKAVVLFGESHGGNYLLRVSEEEGSLLLRWLEPSTQLRTLDWASAPSRVLVVELEEFLVSYQREPGGPWYQEWDSAGMPELLSMQVKAGGRFWPELVVRMK